MAIIITRKDCTLSEANAFYRIEASNMSLVGVLTGIAYVTLAAARYINLTFANAGNFTGAGFVVYATATGDRSLTCELQHGQTATLAIASPGVVGLVSHGFAVGTAVQFTTVGTLPTTVVANTVYYARNTDCVTPANEFWLYGTQAQAIAGGATGRINFTGSSSG
jgi:3',5'-cyclic AMP phosphodiesterase CpdA